MSIADQKYVNITTLRKSGESVTSPVWIAPLGDGRAGFTTGGDSGKVKRIRNNAAVTLQACTMRGAVIAGSPVVKATASIVEGTGLAPVSAAIGKKYRIVGQIMLIPAKVMRLFGKRDDTVGIVLEILSDPS